MDFVTLLLDSYIFTVRTWQWYHFFIINLFILYFVWLYIFICNNTFKIFLCCRRQARTLICCMCYHLIVLNCYLQIHIGPFKLQIINRYKKTQTKNVDSVDIFDQFKFIYSCDYFHIILAIIYSKSWEETIKRRNMS